MRVALFITCMNDMVFPDTGIATVQVLERLGHEVEFPEGQTCCGQLHLNSGYQDAAADLARRFVRLFSEKQVVVAPRPRASQPSETSTPTSHRSSMTGHSWSGSRHSRPG